MSNASSQMNNILALLPSPRIFTEECHRIHCRDHPGPSQWMVMKTDTAGCTSRHKPTRCTEGDREADVSVEPEKYSAANPSQGHPRNRKALRPGMEDKVERLAEPLNSAYGQQRNGRSVTQDVRRLGPVKGWGPWRAHGRAGGKNDVPAGGKKLRSHPGRRDTDSRKY